MATKSKVTGLTAGEEGAVMRWLRAMSNGKSEANEVLALDALIIINSLDNKAGYVLRTKAS